MDLPDSDRDDFSYRRAVDSSSYWYYPHCFYYHCYHMKIEALNFPIYVLDVILH